MKPFRKASFLFPQKFLRRSNEAFVGLSCAIHDVVEGAFCLFMVEVEPKNFIYELLL